MKLVGAFIIGLLIVGCERPVQVETPHVKHGTVVQKIHTPSRMEMQYHPSFDPEYPSKFEPVIVPDSFSIVVQGEKTDGTYGREEIDVSEDEFKRVDVGGRL